MSHHNIESDHGPRRLSALEDGLIQPLLETDLAESRVLGRNQRALAEFGYLSLVTSSRRINARGAPGTGERSWGENRDPLRSRHTQCHDGVDGHCASCWEIA